MTLAGMARRQLFARPLLSALNVAAVALGALLITVILGAGRSVERALTGEATLFHLAVGAKGSPLQLVLSSLYHLDVPTGNIPRETAERLMADPRVAVALPLCLGDNYRGFRIVGTHAGLFQLTRPDESTPLLRLAEGRPFAAPFEVVLGAGVARATGLRIGDTFSGTHGVVALRGAAEHGDFPYTVVGVLAPGAGAFDRALHTPMESVWQVHAKEQQAHDAAKGLASRDPSQEVTAVLLRLKLRAARFAFAEDIRTRTPAMPAVPLEELHRLFQRVLKPARFALLAVAGMVAFAALLSVTATLLQSAERRRRDLAILRCLGARPRQILALLLLEGLWLTGLGVAIGGLGGRLLLQAASWLSQRRSGIALDAWGGDAMEAFALLTLLLAGLLAGLLPGLLGYRRPPSRDLHSV
jgi:putative ABC transport system permease protein